MRLTKAENRNTGECAAFRCRADANGLYVDIDGETVSLCDKHLEKSGASEVDPPGESPAGEPPTPPPPPAAPIDAGTPIEIAAVTERDAELVEVVEQTQVELRNEARELAEALEMVEAYDIEGQEDFEFAEESRNEAKDQWNALEERRKKATRPLNQSLREINGWFKPAKNALEKIQRAWEGKLKAYRLEAAAEQQRLLGAAQAAEDSGERHEAMVAAANAPAAPTSTSYRDNWVFEIENPDLIPREFLVPDEKAISAVVKALKDKTNIPGVRAWNDPIVSKNR